MKRILLFTITNLSVIFVLNIIFKITGFYIQKNYKLIFFAFIFGFIGSLISLFFSKWIALKTVNGNIISKPKNNIEKWITQIIEKQSKKAQIKTPDIAIYESVEINAFATGPGRNNSLIAISSGLLNNMNYNEIEGVLAHEISHISNGDMVTMTLIQGIVNTFVILFSKIIAEIFSNIFEYNKEENITSKYSTVIYFITSTILELTLGIFASIIVMWFSRKREFYADAGAARISGKEKIISALEKLKTQHEPKATNNISSLCINGKRKCLNNLFLSHPSLKLRILALKENQYL